MATERQAPVIESLLPLETVKLDKELIAARHPLDPLTPGEISEVSKAIRQNVVEQTQHDIQVIKFISCNLIPPPKRDVLAALGIPTQTGCVAEKIDYSVKRRAEVDIIDPVSGNTYHITLTWDDAGGAWNVDSIDKLPETVQPSLTIEELVSCVQAVRKDERVVRLLADVGVKPDQIAADGWSIGWDERWPHAKRIQQCYLYVRPSPNDHLYAHPLDFVPILDTNARRVIHIDWPFHRTGPNGCLSSSSGTIPPPLIEDAFKACGRERIPPPLFPQNYLPELVGGNPDHKPRTVEPLKSLHIVQPEGVSFRIVDGSGGRVLEWQNWKMHIGFASRQGLILSTITYDDGGIIRPILYRIDLAEMVVPYGSPDHPHARKMAFDTGEYGFGKGANDLSLGCDCVGSIHYLPGSFIGTDGKPVVLDRAICIHEEDAGVLWKHTDYRLGGRAHSVRSRRLVISTIATLANYEYGIAYHFYLDGTIEMEAKLTGVLNTYLLAQGESAEPYGTQVAPRINAQYHQHIFCFRVDPMIDGLENTVVQSDIVVNPAPTGSEENFAGNAFTSKDTRIPSNRMAVQDYDRDTDRRWRIVNPKRIHYASGKEASYGIATNGTWVKLQSGAGSWLRRRAAFTEHNVWVVREKEGKNGTERQWPAGRYVPQTREHPPDSISTWVKADAGENLESTDLLLFLTIGVTHIPRPEDWPVMPSEHVRLMLKPQNFFDRNPSLLVPSVKDPRSIPAFGSAEKVHLTGNLPDSEGVGSAVHTHDAQTCH